MTNGKKDRMNAKPRKNDVETNRKNEAMKGKKEIEWKKDLP